MRKKKGWMGHINIKMSDDLWSVFKKISKAWFNTLNKNINSWNWTLCENTIIRWKKCSMIVSDQNNKIRLFCKCKAN